MGVYDAPIFAGLELTPEVQAQLDACSSEKERQKLIIRLQFEQNTDVESLRRRGITHLT